MVLAAVLSAVLVNNNVLQPQAGSRCLEPECLTNCAVGAPPLEPAERVAAPRTADRH